MSKKNNRLNFLDISSSSEEEDIEEKKEDGKEISTKQKNNFIYNKKSDLFQGITKETFPDNYNNNIKNDNKNFLKSKEKIQLMQEKLNHNKTNLIQKDILNLPPPKTKLIDKTERDDLFEEEENDDNEVIMNKNKLIFKNLVCPDFLEQNKKFSDNNIELIEKETDINKNKQSFEGDKNIMELQLDDILDKNWETKYIGSLIKKDIYAESKQKAIDEKDIKRIENEEKNNNKKEQEEKEEGIKNKKDIFKKPFERKRKRDKNEINEDDEYAEIQEYYKNQSKYSQISTSKKYGW